MSISASGYQTEEKTFCLHNQKFEDIEEEAPDTTLADIQAQHDMSRHLKDTGTVFSEVNETFVARGVPSTLRETTASKLNRSIDRSSTLRPDMDKTLLIGDLGNQFGLTSDKT